MDNTNLISKLAFAAVILTLCVIALGAYTRIIDAGLGCPDWPGCYGHVMVPHAAAINEGNSLYASTPLNTTKAWAEMTHRYFVGALSILIFSIFILALVNSIKQQTWRTFIPALLLLMMLVYQALLGMWTVTLKLLPMVVSQHFLGGMTIIALLWYIYISTQVRHRTELVKPTIKKLKWFALLGMFLLAAQLFLGVWTSSNYASLSCQSFPFCSAKAVMHWDFKEAFKWFSPWSGIDFQGGVLTETGRQTIHMLHRTGALIVGLYWMYFTLMIISKHSDNKTLIKVSFAVLFFLILQIIIGISNVLLQMPLFLALSHTMGAVLLLLSTLSLTFYLFHYGK